MGTEEIQASQSSRMERQHPFLSIADRTITTISWSGKITAAVCLIVMFITLLLNVILRYAFSSGIVWAYEIHALLLPWLVSGGVVIATAANRNIAITLLPGLLNVKARMFLMLVIQLSMLMISVSILASSQPILKASQFQNLSTLGIKQIWGYASLIYAFIAMAIISLLNIARFLLRDKSLQELPSHTSMS